MMLNRYQPQLKYSRSWAGEEMTVIAIVSNEDFSLH
jgi:hypothetical protein